MNKKDRPILFSFLLLAISIFNTSAEPVIPQQTAWVMDNAQVIDSETENSLNKYLENLDTQTGIQIAVLTVKSLEETAGEDTTIEEYAAAVFEKWRLGQKDKDNGVLILVSIDDRNIRIEVGYGLESVLTDTKCGVIIRKFITPSFREGQYAKGIKNGVEAVAGYASGDEELKTQVDETDEDSGGHLAALIPFLMWAIFLLIVIFSNIFGPKGRGGNRRPPTGGFFVGGGGFGGHSRGGFGGTHGGFGGGGGGRSGGGGASGRW